MTEKIERRGVRVPDSYESDSLGKVRVEDVIKTNSFVLSENSSIAEAREWLHEHEEYKSNYFIISNEKGEYRGILSSSSLFGGHHLDEAPISSLVRRKNISISKNDNLRTAVKRMAIENIDVLPVIEHKNEAEHIVGVVGYQDIIKTYKEEMEENMQQDPNISLKRKTLKILLQGKNLMTKK